MKMLQVGLFEDNHFDLGGNMRRIVNSVIIICVLLALTACGGGGGAASSTGPTAVIQANVQALGTGTTSTVQAAVGSMVDLDGSGSNAPGSAITGYAWALTSKPQTSAATLGAAS